MGEVAVLYERFSFVLHSRNISMSDVISALPLLVH